ncbi:MAG TPA: DegV family protein [Acidimicrobiales bacterium]|nr:DegV family protein [Acidimicrobiales bacterium]
MSVAVVTDSATALPAAVAAAHDIALVPMGLSIGGLPVAESALGLDELIARFDEGVTTSGASPGDFVKAIEGSQTGDGVVVITLASALSSTHRAALLAAEEATGPVRVIDSQTAAGAEGLVAVAAARAAAGGADIEAVDAAARRVIEGVRLVGALSTLEYLMRGGHIPSAAGWAARMLNVQPLIELRHGKVRPLRPAFSRDAALERLVAMWRQSRPAEAADLHLVAMHSLDGVDAQRLVDEVRREVEPVTCFLSGFGTSLVAHTGPGLVGLAWWWEPTAQAPG